jgi:predicted SPOUT superfamily RNA methylase MTH1
LRTPHHPLINKLKDLTVGEYREGVVVASVKNGSLIDVGVERPILISKKRIPVDTRATVKIVDLEETPKGVVVSHDELEEYWGYQVVISNVMLGRLIRKRSFDLVVATSKYGIPFKQVLEELVKRWKKSQKVLVAFGAPTKGLHDIVAQEKLKLRRVADLVVNTIPNQGTVTVRTEEALYASLAILTSLIEK